MISDFNEAMELFQVEFDDFFTKKKQEIKNLEHLELGERLIAKLFKSLTSESS